MTMWTKANSPICTPINGEKANKKFINEANKCRESLYKLLGPYARGVSIHFPSHFFYGPNLQWPYWEKEKIKSLLKVSYGSNSMQCCLNSKHVFPRTYCMLPHGCPEGTSSLMLPKSNTLSCPESGSLWALARHPHSFLTLPFPPKIYLLEAPEIHCFPLCPLLLAELALRLFSG